ncbi:MAG: DegV family protein [Actinomycetota bacterium]|nr:DegV family protein [Actinomycetota bacterium]
MTTAIVTDSTAYLPAGAAAAGVHVVPLRVQLGSRTAVDGVDVTSADLVAALREHIRVSTSRPSPGEFAGAYRSCLAAGADHVVSIHLASALSGTWESAVLASQDFGYGVVRVVDSRATAMGLGWAVLAAAAAARDGASAADVQGAATAVIDRTRTLFYVDTLEFLRRGGRIGTAASLLATSLSVKPLLQMVEGQIVGLEKVRTSSKAISRLVALTLEAAGDGRVDVAVHHLAAAARAESVAEQLRSSLAQLGELHVGELGPVLGAHLGPGVIGTVVVRR